MKRNVAMAAAMVAATTAGAMVWAGGRGRGLSEPGPAAAVQATHEQLKAKEAAMLAPETAVTLDMLQELVQLDVRLNPPTEPQFGMINAGGFSIYDMPAYQAAFTKFGGELARALAAKKEEVRGACVVTLLTMPGKLAAADAAKVAPWVPGVLQAMSKEQVTGILKNRWVTVRSPALLPVLLKMYDGLPDEQVSPGKYGASEERDALLARAYELSPAEVRPRVLAAIKNPGARFYEMWMNSLLGLPDKELPEMDEALAAMTHAPVRDPGVVPRDVWTKLVARYGTVKIEADVKRVYELAPGRWACALQESMLAYFLRVDPAYGKEAFAKAAASRGTGCWQTIFGNVARLIWTPELEQLAIEALDNKDVGLAVGAARALQVHGAPAAKAALLASLGKPYVANAQTTTPAYKEPEAQRRRTIITALLEGHAWVLTAAEVETVRGLAVEPELADLCKMWAEKKEMAVTAAMEGSGKPTLRLESETYESLAALEAKVSMFPAGMKFKVSGDEGDEVRDAFLAWAKEKRLAVE